MPRPRRAAPLTPDARRSAIAHAVAPLLLARGAAVTTKEMAEAAGVAEGTLFTVFPDKTALVLAAVDHHMDPEPLRRSLAAIAPDAPLEARLAEAASVIVAAIDDLIAFGMLLRTLPHRPEQHAGGAVPRRGRPAHGGPAPGDPGGKDPAHGMPAAMAAWSEALTRSVTALLEPHGPRLRLAPERATAALVGLLFVSRRPFTRPEERLTVPEIVRLLLKDDPTEEDRS